MIIAAVTEKFGVLATDSKIGKSHDSPKLFFSKNLNNVFSFSGDAIYLSNLDFSKFSLPFSSLCVYLKEYFLEIKNKVNDVNKDLSTVTSPFCLMVLGTHNNKPTIVKFDSLKGFKSVYTWSTEKTLFSGSDVTINREAEKLLKQNKVGITPGILGGMLIRAAYNNKINGVINVASITKEKIYPLSTYQIL